MLVKYVFLLPITILLISTAAHDICQFTVKVTQDLQNEGFHRNLTYNITFEWGDGDGEVMWYYDGCVLGLQQVLPAGVFANPDELMDLRRAGKLTAFPNNKINIELQMEHSQPSRTYIFSQVSHSTVNTWIPVHARYHRVTLGGGYAVNTIGPPSVFLRCPDSRLEVCKLPITTKTYLCANPNEKCQWKEATPTMLNPLVEWKVPVGNMYHHGVVMFFTMVAVAVGSTSLIKTIHEHKFAYRVKRSIAH